MDIAHIKYAVGVEGGTGQPHCTCSAFSGFLSRWGHLLRKAGKTNTSSVPGKGDRHEFSVGLCSQDLTRTSVSWSPALKLGQ